MSQKKYTTEHEWIVVDGDTATVGITDYAQNALGDVVFAEPPKVGRELKQRQEAAVVESVKAASDIYAPVSGVVTEGNDAITADPGLINRDAENTGWIFKMRLSAPAELEGLLDHAGYEAHIKALG